MKLRSLSIALSLGAGLGFSGSAWADADIAAGEKIFTTKCKVCHAVPGPAAKNLVGPNLTGVIGRKTGSEPGYNYSEANKGSGLTWDEATFKEYITNPKAKIPGTKMVFAGLPKEEDRDNLYAYLAQFNADGTTK